MKKSSPFGKFFGYIALASISIGVFLFLAKHSLNFFQFTFKDSDVIYSWLGLLLTSAGAIGWLAIFIWLADTTTRKGISLIMMLVALAGEMVTAVFDMQNNGQYASGFQFSPQELDNMTFAVGILGAATGLALIAYAAGDMILAEFKKDKDGDGIPDFVDPVDNRTVPEIQMTSIPENVYKQLLQDAAVYGSNGNGANPTPR